MYEKSKMPPAKSAGKKPAMKPCSACKMPGKCAAAGKCLGKK